MPKRIRKPSKLSSKPYPKIEFDDGEHRYELDPVQWDDWVVGIVFGIVFYSYLFMVMWVKING